MCTPFLLFSRCFDFLCEEIKYMQWSSYFCVWDKVFDKRKQKPRRSERAIEWKKWAKKEYHSDGEMNTKQNTETDLNMKRK